ncbi:DnaA/Hda family protein [Rubripirellula reticaptiva]|uniref:Chromosomal replication initiator protein DnaA n=1 Tax=Rubripirellula reticaptiva TaxID=2528013 RepID=A0A5C6ERG3_9BACT|nr:DnaA/Hda family protein [Rubripirellula reticaptiva]TWU51205.1 Chromosomal replication initiator protein DnaA [Rubripirellula reticaptiva]
MKEDCATGMFVPHGCTDDRDVVASFKEALEQRIGADRFRMWFTNGVAFEVASSPVEAETSETGNPSDGEPITKPTSLVRGCVIVRVRGQFALDRLKKNFLSELRGAAMQACGSSTNVSVELAAPQAAQAELPLGEASKSDSAPRRSPVRSRRQASAKIESQRGKTMSMSGLVASGAGTVRNQRRAPKVAATVVHGVVVSSDFALGGTPQPQSKSPSKAPTKPAGSDTSLSKSLRDPSAKAVGQQRPMNAQTFVSGSCNQLAFTAMSMVCQQPGLASPLFLCGPTGSGKTHMLTAIADQFRRHHRMRRVMHLSAEQFTNDFITSVGNSGITSFRRRYREVDALLIDDVQFLGSKKATLREVLYTVETLAAAGRPLIFSGSHAPTEIQGLTHELAGRMSSGLVCPMGPLDLSTRETILRRWLGDTCSMPVDDAMVTQLTSMLAGDGRVISGVVNTINLLQRMYGRNPSMDEVRRFGGDVLRSAKPVASLSVIETAVCDAFQLPLDVLRSGAQTRAVSEPRMLAMYLSRQMTSAAYTEIAKHFGGKSHSTAMAAEKNVKGWLEKGKSIGRGNVAMSAQEAIERIENLLRA